MSLPRIPVQYIAILALGCASLMCTEEISQTFANPPAEYRPDVIWYWRHEMQTQEAVTADLEAMHRVGIGGALIGFIGGTDEPKGSLAILSDDWRRIVQHTCAEARRLGMRLSLFNAPGWSSTGGPWVPPNMAMQQVAWSETRAPGGKSVGKLPAAAAADPRQMRNRITPEYFESIKEPWYRDIAVIAFPTPVAELADDGQPAVSCDDPTCEVAKLRDGSDRTFATIANPTPGQTRFLTYVYEHPYRPRTVIIAPRVATASFKTVEVQRSDDGTAWTTVLRHQARMAFAVQAAIPEALPARFWRIGISTDVKGGPSMQIAEVSLSPGLRVTDWSAKSMSDRWGMSRPPFSDLATHTDPAAVIPFDQVRVLTDRLSPDGTLDWTPPAGDWTILRFGAVLTQAVNAPATPSGTGLEIDKYNPAAVDLHWSKYIAPLIADPAVGGALRCLHIDSYEKGNQNWSSTLPGEFGKRRGYDLTPFLPVMTGRVIGDVRLSERFLWDLRKTLCDSMADNYYGHFAKRCEAAGLELSIEPYCQIAFDSAVVGGRGHQVMTEFWQGGMPSKNYFKNAASPARVYGHRIVSAESFSGNPESGGNFSTAPWDMKRLGDRAYLSGVNRFVFHVYNQQPWLDLKPGVVGRWGQQMNRNNTWFDLSYGWMSYLTRCQMMLQSGHFVGDMLASTGENSPSEGGWTAPNLPPGYDFDNITPEMIIGKLRCEEGRFRFPMADGSGASAEYAPILVLPEDSTMTSSMARALLQLVQSGATIVGPRPQRSPSLGRQPQEDDELQRLATALWGDGAGPVDRMVGSGRVISGKTIDQVLKSLHVDPDIVAPRGIDYSHRRIDGMDVYFMSNQSDATVSADISFRVGKGRPELWDPLDGSIRRLSGFSTDRGRTVVSLRFEERQSYFIVFRDAEIATTRGIDFPKPVPVAEITGAWDVAFDPRWGGPSAAEGLPGRPGVVRFDTLQDWSKRPEDGIRYYSGKAVYTKTIDVPPAHGSRLLLNLGKIANIAEVRLNGENLGAVWCAPWRIDITGAAKPTGNLLEITVANLWVNRLIGDERLPEEGTWKQEGGVAFLTSWPDWLTSGKPRTSGRYTFSTARHWTKDAPLVPSGLLGPVTILVDQPDRP